MFRPFTRTEQPETDDPHQQEGPRDGAPRNGAPAQGKGRPTPTRREAQAKSRARAKPPRDKKAAKKLQRERRADANEKYRQGLKTGDERYLPQRDKGPVRRFVRDRIDSRLCMAEFMLPLLLATMVLLYSPKPALQAIANGIWLVTILVVGVDTAFLVYSLKREVRRRFPDDPGRGIAFYAVLRALQLRFLRLPKPQVKLGQKLPERY